MNMKYIATIFGKYVATKYMKYILQQWKVYCNGLSSDEAAGSKVVCVTRAPRAFVGKSVMMMNLKKYILTRQRHFAI